MKYVVPVFSLLLLITSCGSDPTDITADRLVGDFFRVKENGREGNNSNATIESITFRSKFCNFNYNGTPMSGKYSVDEGYVYIEAGGELGTLSLEIVNENQLEGEGFIHGTFGREGFEGEIIEVSGNGRNGDVNNSGSNGTSGENGSTSSVTESSGNSGESTSTDKQSGSSSSSASSSTDKTTSSSSTSTTTPAVAKRFVVKHLNTSNMRSGASANIGLILTINAKGMVVETKLDKSKTTTNNEVLVNSVTAAVKKEVRYNEVAGSGYQRVNYLVKL